jgi:hypothetical protein
MSAEKDKDGVGFWAKVAEWEEQLDRLNRRHSNYCQEVIAISLQLEQKCSREIVLAARLKDLQVRLIPQVQARIVSLQSQTGGGIP